ncbi:hypothetical protein CY34DRAFT_25648 [Suillus luteus UH-Slu-Lm8-n1]|uniref:Unplaced genomic scaffold CY34scaffold_262, whole genome shotgun sequence n=1 Tax=Suillus luteus UH-Slu-Lm8-n1 TaxID=930992 RepID=A0A0D0AVL5_9AGAM|nr:hypothetical protein CY34DRAFT_25648 [Suillus luteus UH-Slu-Lm8-n1]
MASESTTEDHSAVKKPNGFPPLLSKKFGITDIKQDAVKWNKEWEAAIASLTAADVLKEISQKLDDSFFTPQHMELFHKSLRSLQTNVAEILSNLLNNGHFDTIWLLLNAAEQRKHILEGLKRASEDPSTIWGPDCRALCPEVTVSNFLSQSGKGFIDFLTRVAEIFGSPITPAFLPNSWWEQASNLPNPWWGQASDVSPQRQISQSTKLVFEVATITRNQFIGEWQFVLSSAFSIVSDITNRGEGMKEVLHFMENTKGHVARCLAEVKTTFRDKPIIRCENCTKTPDDIGQNVRFMVCSVCKTKLKFEVHYCSQSCQKEHWSVHKKACGKKKVTRGLSGTKGDFLWAFSDSDPVANLMRNLPKKEGRLTLRDIGVNPCNGKRSPAAERQAKMLEADKDVDYFLFTASGEPVRFVIDDLGAKMIFRINRGMIMTQPTDTTGVNAIGEYMLKLMSNYPGLSRDIIIKQLCEEYGEDIAEKIVELEQMAYSSDLLTVRCSVA